MALIPRNKLLPGWFHCINRGVNRQRIFLDTDDYQRFTKSLIYHAKEHEVDLGAFCLMPNHWHIVMCFSKIENMSSLFRILLNGHTKYHHQKYQTIGHGPIYQGRFKSIRIENDRDLLRIAEYVELNPVRGNLVKSAKDWRWCSATWGQ